MRGVIDEIAIRGAEPCAHGPLVREGPQMLLIFFFFATWY